MQSPTRTHFLSASISCYVPSFPDVEAAPRGLLPRADKAYSATPKPQTQQPNCTPTQWALKTLAINTSQALVAHIHKSTTIAYRSLHDDCNLALTCRYTPYKAAPVETLAPFPHFALPAVA